MICEKAMLAGLMHDCAKCMPNAKKLKTAEKNHLEITDLERRNPFMLHAKLGAFLARKKYDIEDQEVLDAIRWHNDRKTWDDASGKDRLYCGLY